MSAPRGSAWSDEDERMLEALWNNGASGSEIGVVMGRTKNAIIAHAWRRGLMGRKPSMVPVKYRRETGKRNMIVGHVQGPRPVTQEDAERALSRVPPDTRTQFARFMGDPLPGRSALDRLKINSTPVDKSADFVAEPKCPLHLVDRLSNEEAVQ